MFRNKNPVNAFDCNIPPPSLKNNNNKNIITSTNYYITLDIIHKSVHELMTKVFIKINITTTLY